MAAKRLILSPALLALLALIAAAGAATTRQALAAATAASATTAATAASAAPPAGSAPLATVDGQPITEADVVASSVEFQRLEQEYQKNKFKLLSTHMKQLAQERAIAAEAAARGLTKEQVLAEAPKPAPVTDSEVELFYEQNKAKVAQPKEQVLPRIRTFLEQQRQTDVRNQLLTQLETKHNVRYLLEPPRVELATAGFPARGPINAPVTVVEFSDFQCPYCASLRPTLEQVVARYGDKVRLVFRQFPLPQHGNAAKAAEAALCANEQGKFWPMHDALFGDQSKLDVASLKSKAAALGLDGQSFDACLDSGKEAAAVRGDFKAGEQAGVPGTPALFVNGRAIDLAPKVAPLDAISQVIDEELKRKTGAR
ncbi:MAG TPA: thioredoxin domain-containing protein [Thermoanaerobaculia bacterium]|nr:thioredoxin domain-containing protein [Thermoanaerobaculia bacterium]